MKKLLEKSSAAGKRKPGGAGKLDSAGSLWRQTKYFLCLYVSGPTLRSSLAVENIKRICDQHLKNRYDLKIIDIYQHPNLARSEQIVAAPTLVKRLPPPLRRLIGDLSNQENVLRGLGLRKAAVVAGGRRKGGG
jgi:circadian clock protein KaiB